MRRSVLATLLAGSALLAAAFAWADESRLRRYELPNLDTLELTLPPAWVDNVDVPPGGAPLTIQLTPADGAPFAVHLTPQSPDPTAARVMDSAALYEAVRESAERIRPQTIEETVDIERLRGTRGAGYFYSLTDREPPPGEFRYMTQGALQVGALIVWFTILTNDGQAAEVDRALAMLQSLEHRGTGQDLR
jgi:hypothetical protein